MFLYDGHVGINTSEVTPGSEGNHGIRVSIVDDDPMVCQLMSTNLTDNSNGLISVCSTASSGGEALSKAKVEHPDLVLMDINMPCVDGITATAAMRTLSPRPHVLILTALSPADTAQKAVEAGAEGFVSKAASPEDIINTILEICRGNLQLNMESQLQLARELQRQRPRSRQDEARSLLASLPERERQTVLLAAQGLTNAEIAKRMYISQRTSKAHLANASEKLNMNRMAMARLVERADLPQEE